MAISSDMDSDSGGSTLQYLSDEVMPLPNYLERSRKSLKENAPTGRGRAGKFFGAAQTSNERKQRAGESDQVQGKTP